MTERPKPSSPYPRQSARTQRYTLGEPRDVVVSPDGRRIVFLRSRGPTTRSTACGCVDAATGEERLVADPRRPAPRPRRRPRCRPRSAPAANARARPPAGSPPSPPTPQVTVAAVRHRRPAVRRRPAQRRRPASSPSPGRCSTPAPTRSPGASPTSAAGCCASASSTGSWVLAGDDPTSPRRHVGQRRLHRRRGDAPLPRLLVEPRRDRHRRRPGRHGAGARAGTSAIRRNRRRRRPSCAYPAAGTANADVTLHLVALDGTVVDVEWDRGAVPVPRRRALDRRRPDHHRAAARPARSSRCSRSTRRPASTELRWADMDDQWVELVPGVPRLGAGRRAGHVRRPGRRPPAARRRRAGDARRPAGAGGRERRRARASCSSPTRSTTPPCCTSGGGRRTGELEALDRRARGPHRRRRRAARSSCARPRSPSRARSGRRSTASS